MTTGWPTISYDTWAATCDTLHAHTQVLGKLAVRLAPPEPELQHAALRLTARGWETAPLPAPDGSGSLLVGLDLRTHEAVVEHSGGAVARIPLTPNRAVADVSSDVLGAVAAMGGAVQINPGGAHPRGLPRAVPGPVDTGQRVVGNLRPGGGAVLRSTCRRTVERLHHAQRRRRPSDRDRLVAWRRSPPGRGFLRIRSPGPAHLRAWTLVAGRCALG